MQIKTWHAGMSTEETKDLAYWERNTLALHFAEGWYNDDVWGKGTDGVLNFTCKMARYDGWRRVLSLEGGSITFHIPDDFNVGNLPEIEPNWDGHTTAEKWQRVLEKKGIQQT